MYKKMVEIRCFENRIYFLFLGGKMPGTIHLYAGEEAIATGVCAALEKDDVITSTHRPHGHALAKDVSLNSLMAELFGKKTGCCEGKGGSMHVGDAAAGSLPAIAIVGGNLPIAAGAALAFKFQKSDQVAVSFFGDGAANEGLFHETLNMAAIWNLPVIFVCENNLYGASTAVSKVMKIESIAERAGSYGIPGKVVDGNDVLAVYNETKEAVERARKGEGPTLLECKTYRRGGHSRGDPCHYRDKEEERIWLAKDPILKMKKMLLAQKILKEEDALKIEKETEVKLDEAVKFAEESPSPEPEDTLKGLWA